MKKPGDRRQERVVASLVHLFYGESGGEPLHCLAKAEAKRWLVSGKSGCFSRDPGGNFPCGNIQGGHGHK